MFARHRSLLFVAALLALTAAPFAAADAPAAPEPASLDSFLVSLAAEGAGEEAPAACAQPEAAPGLDGGAAPLAAGTSCCKSQCSIDRDCDRVCGGKGTGQCVMVNSCCRECACSL